MGCGLETGKSSSSSKSFAALVGVFFPTSVSKTPINLQEIEGSLVICPIDTQLLCRRSCRVPAWTPDLTGVVRLHCSSLTIDGQNADLAGTVDYTDRLVIERAP